MPLFELQYLIMKMRLRLTKKEQKQQIGCEKVKTTLISPIRSKVDKLLLFSSKQTLIALDVAMSSSHSHTQFVVSVPF